MQSKYHLLIYAFDTVEYFMIYDEKNRLFYNGNIKIRDNVIRVSSLEKVYTRFHLVGMKTFQIDEKCFNLCLDLDFSEISKMTMQKALTKLGLYEHII
jgi:hypothetical protein